MGGTRGSAGGILSQEIFNYPLPQDHFWCIRLVPSFTLGVYGGGAKTFFDGGNEGMKFVLIKLLCVSVASVSELPSSWSTWTEVRRNGSLVLTEWR